MKAASLCLLALASIVFAQSKSSQKPLKFEVASIHPNNSGSDVMGGGCRGTDTIARPAGLPSIGETTKGNIPIRQAALGRCQFTNVTLAMLIERAYNLDINQGGKITGGPKWLDSDRFDMEAAAQNPSKTTEAQLYLMLQQLLADRFHLRFHNEKQPSQSTVLVIDSAERPSQN
jgi:uncharacterized protein (TIGR03435 family)